MTSIFATNGRWQFKQQLKQQIKQLKQKISLSWAWHSSAPACVWLLFDPQGTWPHWQLPPLVLQVVHINMYSMDLYPCTLALVGPFSRAYPIVLQPQLMSISPTKLPNEHAFLSIIQISTFLDAQLVGHDTWLSCNPKHLNIQKHGITSWLKQDSFNRFWDLCTI